MKRNSELPRFAVLFVVRLRFVWITFILLLLLLLKNNYSRLSFTSLHRMTTVTNSFICIKSILNFCVFDSLRPLQCKWRWRRTLFCSLCHCVLKCNNVYTKKSVNAVAVLFCRNEMTKRANAHSLSLPLSHSDSFQPSTNNPRHEISCSNFQRCFIVSLSVLFIHSFIDSLLLSLNSLHLI